MHREIAIEKGYLPDMEGRAAYPVYYGVDCCDQLGQSKQLGTAGRNGYFVRDPGHALHGGGRGQPLARLSGYHADLP
jgi:hypothetical protein